LQRDPDNPRNVFYLAQTYRDAGDLAKARETYRRRAALAGWPEEVWYSLFEVAKLGERLGEDAGTLRNAYLDAYQYRPQRSASRGRTIYCSSTRRPMLTRRTTRRPSRLTGWASASASASARLSCAGSC
jgi:hypothetical protein